MRTIMIETVKNVGMGLLFVFAVATVVIWGPFVCLWALGDLARHPPE